MTIGTLLTVEAEILVRGLEPRATAGHDRAFAGAPVRSSSAPPALAPVAAPQRHDAGDRDLDRQQRPDRAEVAPLLVLVSGFMGSDVALFNRFEITLSSVVATVTLVAMDARATRQGRGCSTSRISAPLYFIPA